MIPETFAHTSLDQKFLKARKTKKPEHWDAVFEEINGPVYRLGLKITGRIEHAEDVLQETKVRAIEHANSFDGQSTVRVWMFKIARNAAIDIAKKETRRRYEELDENKPDEGESPLELALQKERYARVHAAIESLPDIYRIPFVMHHLEGMSQQEIANTLNRKLDTVKGQIHRGTLGLRKQLDKKAL
jgi:RNA polymerase sigma-70 factor (ECF subfamily)